jgi:hypothetical protein
MSHGADDYTPKQNARDAEYRRQYAEWIASLDPDELARVKAAGLDQPASESDGQGGTFSENDLADTPLASQDSDLLERIEPACDQPGYQAQRTDAEQVWDAVRRLIGELLVQENPRLAIQCVAFVSGVTFIGSSMAEIARRNGVTLAEVRHRCVESGRKLDLPPAAAISGEFRRARVASHGDGPNGAHSEAVWDVVRRLIGELLIQKNKRLALECLALVSGLSFLGDSMTEIARRHRVTRAAVSKRCVDLAHKIGLPPSRAMRSLTARVSYARARKQRLRSNAR